MISQATKGLCRSGFTLVEVLLTVAIIGVMASIAISKFSNAADDSREVIVRQQQAALQTAVNNWVAGSATLSVSELRSLYNNEADSLARLNLVKIYLDDLTYEHFIEYTDSSNQLETQALSRLGKHLTLPTWADGSYPKVELLP
ncbi:MAG: type II secretion system protein [Verrucomicrobiota bacterium]